MLDGAMRMARRGQPVVISPFTLAGAMAPVTLAGAIAQQTAEALAAIVLLQHVRPGTPVVMGAFTSNVDMRTGAPAFGTPEYMRAAQMSGQMARFYGLPLRSSNACAANCPDTQAAWESVFSLWAVQSARANLVYHAAGWLEGGLCASDEKFVIDCETLQQMIAYNRPIGVTDADLAVDTIAEVGPTGHFFGTRHTGSLRNRVLYAFFVGLAELRDMGGDRGHPHGGTRQHRLEGCAGGVRGPADRPDHRRGTRGVRRPAQGRGRRPDRLLRAGRDMA